MSTFFAVVPAGEGDPSALFVEIEDAIVWGLERYGSDQFRIRSCCTVAREVASPVYRDRSQGS